jgi:hypothetical protein
MGRKNGGELTIANSRRQFISRNIQNKSQQVRQIKTKLKKHNFVCAVLIVMSCLLVCRLEPNRFGASHMHCGMAELERQITVLSHMK